MLRHVAPKCFCRWSDVSIDLIDVTVPELDLVLHEGTDLRVGHAYPNRGYRVASPHRERAIKDGILIETDKPVREFTMITRWALQAEHILSHSTTYCILDDEFDAASSDPLLRGPDRWPDSIPRIAPVALRPRLEVGPDGPEHKGAEPFLMPSLDRQHVLAEAGKHLPGNRRLSGKFAFRAGTRSSDQKDIT